MGPKPLPRGKALAALATRQHGVVSVRQLRALGYSPGEVKRAAGTGHLHRLHRGVYAVGHLNLDPFGVCLAAVLGSGPGALASHGSAAWLWGLARSGPRVPQVTAPLPRPRRDGTSLHHSRTLTAEDRALVAGIPLTSVARTYLDVAAMTGDRRLARLLERGEELRVLDLRAAESVLRRNRGHAGAGRLSRALVAYRPPPFTRSQLERRFLELLAGDGFPRPVTGWNEAGYELDVYWPELRFAVELDAFETHGGRRAFEADRLPEEDLKLAGIEITRVTAARLDTDPVAVLRRVAQLLEQRRRQLGVAVP